MAHPSEAGEPRSVSSLVPRGEPPGRPHPRSYTAQKGHRPQAYYVLMRPVVARGGLVAGVTALNHEQ